MGTNFYLKGHRHTDDPKYHLGKRSAAGYYCWDCGVTLCKGGESEIHSGHSEWHDACPQCGQKKQREGWESSGGRELGFNDSPPKAKKGVRTCASFSWARKLGRVKHIEDEYGRHYTLEEFRQVLAECPVQFTHSMGQWFS